MKQKFISYSFLKIHLQSYNPDILYVTLYYYPKTVYFEI